MELFHTILCIVLVVSRCAGDDGQVRAASHSVGDQHRAATCPDQEVIFPCVCIINDLDCSNVESEEQLAHIMASSFPDPNFFSLTIRDNKNLKVLRAGVLAGTTYGGFNIYNNVLEVVEPGALSGSSLTATWMEMSDNRISSFPWEEISSFTLLGKLSLERNNISKFPSFRSDTLSFLDLSNNPLGWVPATAFTAMPQLSTIRLKQIGLTDIIPGTFVGLPDLHTLYLSDNSLVHLPSGVIEMSDSSYSFVSLSRNNISSVAVNAISGLSQHSSIYLWFNQLTVLEEEVWRPLLQDNVELNVYGNPLLCDCDIAWLVLNSNFLDLLEEATKCSSGEVLVELDPAIFQQC